ncbi:hypothetical protein [Georgenia wangjunii]|uniref:hypothetical protein n=1 Tax=Georgenia wangjunii TaxID=3117730 RepID=UPI002F26065D
MIAKAVAGAAVGIVWFVVLAVTDSARAFHLEQTGQVPWVPLALAALVSALVLWVSHRLGRPFAAGMCGALLVSIAVGLVVGPSPAMAPAEVLSFPPVFEVGSASAVTWVALGVSLAAAARQRVAPRQGASEEPVTAR